MLGWNKGVSSRRGLGSRTGRVRVLVLCEGPGRVVPLHRPTPSRAPQPPSHMRPHLVQIALHLVDIFAQQGLISARRCAADIGMPRGRFLGQTHRGGCAAPHSPRTYCLYGSDSQPREFYISVAMSSRTEPLTTLTTYNYFWLQYSYTDTSEMPTTKPFLPPYFFYRAL
eukprot:1188457-Prorocentrum_minimum.AAC.1